MEEKIITTDGESAMVVEGEVKEEVKKEGEEGEVKEGEATEEEKSAQAAEVKQPVKKQTAQERIDEITKHRREEERQRKNAEREREYWKNVAMSKIEQSTGTVQNAPPPPAQNNEGAKKPVLHDFETVEEFERNLLRWHEQETNLRKEKEDIINAEKQFLEKAGEFEKEHPDFFEVVNAPIYPPAVKEVLFQMNSVNGAMLAYNLALPANRKLADKIKSLPPRLQIYELGKFEANLLSVKPTIKPTNTPPPINPVNTEGGGGGVVDTSKMPDEEFYKYDEERKIAELRKQKKRLGG